MVDEKNQVEALLFSSGKFMTEENLSLLIGIDIKLIKKALLELKNDYDSRDNSLMLVKDNDSWKINVREKYLNLVRKIVADTELPKGVLETLAVIAWKNPAKQSDIINTRGNKAYEHIAQLEEMGFVKKDKDGRSFKLKLAEKFFEYFDVEGNKDIKEMFKNVKMPKKNDQKTLGEENVPVPQSESGNAEDIGENNADAKQAEIQSEVTNENNVKDSEELEFFKDDELESEIKKTESPDEKNIKEDIPTPNEENDFTDDEDNEKPDEQENVITKKIPVQDDQDEDLDTEIKKIEEYESSINKFTTDIKIDKKNKAKDETKKTINDTKKKNNSPNIENIPKKIIKDKTPPKKEVKGIKKPIKQENKKAPKKTNEKIMSKNKIISKPIIKNLNTKKTKKK